MRLKTNLREIAIDYVRVCRLVPALLEQSGKTPEEIYKKLGISKTTYYTRLKQNDWLPEELILIGELLEETPGKKGT